MGKFLCTKDLKFSRNFTAEMILVEFEKTLSNSFTKVNVDKNTSPHQFSGQIKTKLFNPIVTVKGQFNLKLNKDEASIMIDANPTTNAWFWGTLCFAFVGPFLFFLMLYMWHNQNKKIDDALVNSLEQMSFNLS